MARSATTKARVARAPVASAPAEKKEPSKAPAVLSLKITLNEIRPAIWRRILLPANSTLEDLHYAIQVTFPWGGGHLHAFEIGDAQYADPSHELEGTSDQARLRLDRIAKSMAQRSTYVYDFGDNWRHTVLIEKRLPKILPPSVPACIAGARCAPPEDCGGIGGYYDLLEILADPKHPEYAERAEGFEDYDPEEFSVAETDARVAKWSRRE